MSLLLPSIVDRLARRVTRGRPHLLVVAALLLGGAAGWIGAWLLRYEFTIARDMWTLMAASLPYVLLAQCLCFYGCGVFRILWPHFGVGDVLIVLKGTVCSAGSLLAVQTAVLPAGLIPHSIIVLYGLLTAACVGWIHVALRCAREAAMRPRTAGEPALIIGAGDSGDTLLNEIERASPAPVHVVGFLDDDPSKQGGLLRGLPVLGSTADAPRVAADHGVKRLLVALPNIDGTVLRRIVGPLLDAGLSVQVLPPMGRLSTIAPLLPQLRDVAIEDLLRRSPVRLHSAGVSGFLRGASVLVTGAAGSIGSELCRQILTHAPSRLVAYDWAETPLHDLMLELQAGRGSAVVAPELGDVTDAVRVRDVFHRHAPDVVFHAAALKHVPVCEDHPREAVRVNVGGTRVVADRASRSGSRVFLLVSTDKAVNPSSVMGASKRTAELIVQQMNGGLGPTRFTAVRFGNVLGSNGSVLRVFRNQIARGGPLTVTHPDMRRYFMTIPEAVELLLQAAVLGRGGEIFELDMGAPVRIVDLAEDFIRLCGLVPGRDIKIEFTGVRPGEKLFEELYCHSETVVPTEHPKLFRLRATEPGLPDPAVRLCLERIGVVDRRSDPVLAGLHSDLSRLLEAPERVATP